MRSRVAEAELQNCHARNVVPITQRSHIGSDDTQVLRKEWQPSELFAKHVKEIISRTIYPAAVNCRGLMCGYLPKLSKATEVIQADVIAGLRGPAQAFDPPVITLCA